jgi:hypothetical protein
VDSARAAIVARRRYRGRATAAVPTSRLLFFRSSLIFSFFELVEFFDFVFRHLVAELTVESDFIFVRVPLHDRADDLREIEVAERDLKDDLATSLL